MVADVTIPMLERVRKRLRLLVRLIDKQKRKPVYIVNHLTEHVVMNAALLYESPFTDITPTGPDGLFTSAQVDELVHLLDEVHTRAVA